MSTPQKHARRYGTERRPGVPLLVLLLSAWAASAHAQTVYKSVDAEGNVQYSAKPVPNTRSTALDLRPGAVSDAQAQEQLEALTTEAEQRRKARELFAQEADKVARERRERARSCGQARANLQSLGTQQRVQTTDTEGNLVTLPFEQKQRRMAEIRAQIAEFCR